MKMKYLIRIFAAVLLFVSAAGCERPVEITWDASSLHRVTGGVYARVKVLSDGRLALVYSAGPAVCMRTSVDGGDSWSEAAEIARDQRYNYTNSELLELHGGRLLYLWNARPRTAGECEYKIMGAVSDDGGGSGMLRRDIGMLPPGDIRNCLQALANTEPTMEALLAYRFQDGALRGQSFGNLFLAALNGMCDTFDEAVARMSEVLAITGRVLPVTNENVQLLADFDDGVTVTGESQIAEYKKDLTRRIVRAYLSPEHPAALPACLDAIREADLIVLGPGSLYTSVIPNLLVSGIREAIHESDAVKVYVMNLMTQSGETAGYTAVDHVRALFDHGGEGLFDYTLVNDLPIPPEAQEEYLREGAVPITADEEALTALGVTVRYAPVALWQKALVRHDPAALAAALRDLYREASPTRIYG